MEPPVLPSQGGETSVVRVNECPRYSVYETNASNMAPDQFIPGIPLELPAPPMERESTPFLPPQMFIPPELAINPPTEKEKAILYRMHQGLSTQTWSIPNQRSITIPKSSRRAQVKVLQVQP